MNLILANLRYTLRQITKKPGFFHRRGSGAGAGDRAPTRLFFSAVDAVLLRPLPYANPGRLVMVWEDASFIGFALNTPAPANYLDWKAQNQVFHDMTATRLSTGLRAQGGACSRPAQRLAIQRSAARCPRKSSSKPQALNEVRVDESSLPERCSESSATS